MSTQLNHLKSELEETKKMFQAACLLADRYRKERDGARAAKAAAVAKAASNGESVADAVAKALAGSRGANLLARDRNAVAKDGRPNVQHDLTDSIRERADNLKEMTA